MIVVLIRSVNILTLKHSVRSYCVDHFGVKFERRRDDAGEHFVLSCQLWQLSDDFSQLHGQADQLRSENARLGRDAEEQTRSIAAGVCSKLPSVLRRH